MSSPFTKDPDRLEAAFAALERDLLDADGPRISTMRSSDKFAIVAYSPADEFALRRQAWPLLDPQWKDPKKWWGELSKPSGRKDYDWSRLAARYWPERVDAKCKDDPSLGVAHGCFWRYHPARAYSWELRLQDEIGPEFRIDEPDADAHRAAFLRDHAVEAQDIRAKEERRREKKRAKAEGGLFEPTDEPDDGVQPDEGE